MVNEDISHATPTAAPITRAAAAGEEAEMCRKKAPAINKMGHGMNVGCAPSTVRRRKVC